MRAYKAEHGVSYVSKYRNAEYNAKLDSLPKDPVRMAVRKQEAWHRRRSRKLAVPTEMFKHEDVYERDGWVCRLCSKAVDRSLCYPDFMSASLDHIIPLGKGGHHVWDNVHLAHLDCNQRKQARLNWNHLE